MYGKGGHVLIPEHRPLPIKKLTAEQKRENVEARKKWREVRDEINRIANEASKRIEALGGYIPTNDGDYDDGGVSYPELVLPHPEDQYDLDAFTEADRAVYDYQILHPWEHDSPDEAERLRALMNAEVKVVWGFRGMSADHMPVTEADRLRVIQDPPFLKERV